MLMGQELGAPPFQGRALGLGRMLPAAEGLPAPVPPPAQVACAHHVGTRVSSCHRQRGVETSVQTWTNRSCRNVLTICFSLAGFEQIVFIMLIYFTVNNTE